MFGPTIKLPLLIISLITLLVVIDAKRTRDIPKALPVKVPDYFDRWDFTTEFNNLCTGIFPDDGESTTPILKETNAEPAKSSQFNIQSRVSDLKGSVLFSVSCIYRYSDGQDHQLGSYIAEQLGGRTLAVEEHLSKRKLSKR
ncbi:uncharacterized protein L201_005214 [Kwoniella dendrophila CBS 6074]|uniref:Uncharacterized protein n=1 Tax=Kwoniella dendrophila CBS 6074 TaxID=1295534 RepID=A0AAX4JXT1_9TREE